MGANKEQILSIIRYSLTTIGTIDNWNIKFINGISNRWWYYGINGIWSILDKTDSNIIKMAEYQAKLEAEKVN
jgi:hypothetical protein